MLCEGIGGEIRHSIHQYAKADNKYMKDYNRNREQSYLKYLNINNLHGRVMSQRLPLGGF